MSEILGSMADVPKDLLAEVQKLEQQFTVPTEKLKAISKHFISELDKGESQLLIRSASEKPLI